MEHNHLFCICFFIGKWALMAGIGILIYFAGKNTIEAWLNGFDKEGKLDDI